MNQELITIGKISLSGILLALITVYVNHLFANSRDKIKQRRDQGQTISKAFDLELHSLIYTNEDCRLILTQEAYQRHEAAVRTFSRNLSWIDRLRLKLLWYRLAMIKIDKKHHMPFYEQYADCGALDKRRKVRPIVIKRIQDIISFANR
jgi:hypothetical protein